KFIEKIICQQEINEILSLYGHLKDIEFITAVLDHLKIERVVEGISDIDSTKRYIFASNHPLGGVDGFVLSECISNHFGDVRVVVNDILMNITPVKDLFTPINKHGRQVSLYAEGLNKVVKSDVPMIYFPSGLCSRRIEGKVQDPPWHKSFVKKAIEGERDIIPVWVDCLNSNFFYNFAYLRKRFNIKANLEMMLLPSELFKKKESRIRIVFGKPISYEDLIKEKDTEHTTQKIREACYRLQTL
ncbi:MAG: 1-acyl-sn-glycerol-3-phosphate acyltransferase, partial [Rikenellaceae bacterium]